MVWKLTSLLMLLGSANAAPSPDFIPRVEETAVLMASYMEADGRQGDGGEGMPVGDKIFAYPYEKYNLESNGMSVIIVPLGDDFPGIVSVHTTVIAGSRDEVEEGKTGMAHFFEHMMFRGTNNVSSEEYDAIIEEIGASYNAWTWLEKTNYYSAFPKTAADGSSNLDTVLFLESDRFRYLNYTEDDFKTEAGAILGEYNRYANLVWFNLSVTRADLCYDVHTYGHNTLGTIEDIRDMPNEEEYSRLFFERFYKPENVVLMIFGDVEVDETKTLVEKYYGDWVRGEGYKSDIPQEPLKDKARYRHVAWPEASSPWISLSFLASNFTVTEIDTAALDIIQFMVFSPASELYQKLVLQEQVVLDLSASYNWFKDPGLFTIDANVDKVDNIWYARDEILEALARLRSEFVSINEISRVASNLKYGAAKKFTSATSIADEIQYYVALTGSPDAINQIYGLYDTITPQIIMDIANKYFTDNRLATITLAFEEEPLPEPPVVAAEEDHPQAGSVNSFVMLKSSDEDDFQVDQVVIPSDSSQLVYFDIRFRTGASDDPEGKEGLSFLTTKMMSAAGTASLTLEEIQDILFPMAASFSGGTGKEYTYFSGLVHIDNRDEYYEIMSEMLLNPGFREEDFERIKTEVIRGIQDAVFSDSAVAARAFDGSVFEGHPYEHNSAGTIESIRRITLDDVKEYYTSRFTRQNVILGMTGGFSDEFIKKVNGDLSKLPDGPVDKELLVSPPLKATSNAIIIEQAATQATTVTLGYPLSVEKMTPGHPEYASLMIAINYYGGYSFIAKLMSEIRVKRGINYGTYARLRYAGSVFQVNIGAMDTPEIAHFAARLALYELNKILTEGIDQESFEFFRNSVFNSLPLSVDTPAKVLSTGIDGLEYGYGDDYLSYMQSALSNVTLEEVNAAAKKWLQDEALTFVFVTPNATDLQQRLVDGATSVMTYPTDDKPEDVLLTDEIVKDYPLGLQSENVEIVSAADLFPGADEEIPVVSETEQEGNDGEGAVVTTSVAVNRDEDASTGKTNTTSAAVDEVKGDDIDALDMEVTSDSDASVAVASSTTSGVDSEVSKTWRTALAIFSLALGLWM